MKEYKGLTEEQMMAAMVEVATVNGYTPDEDDDEATFEDVFTPECSNWLLEEYFTLTTESEKYIVEQVLKRGAEGDGAEMYLTFKITNKETGNIGYLEYSGRYSSWDSSYYDECYVVEPEEVTVIQYNRIK
jgi:hypothetical protein